MRLDSDSRKTLLGIMRDAYPRTNSLVLVLDPLDKNIEDLTTDNTTREEKYLQIIQNAEARNWIKSLIGGIHDHHEGNEAVREKLQVLAARIEASEGAGSVRLDQPTLFGRAFTDEADAVFTRALQRTVRRGQHSEEFGAYAARIGLASGALCAIEWSGEHQGCGFLIGPRTIITNHHVVFPLLRENVDLLRARFGFEKTEDGIQREGTPVAFAADWHIFSRPPDPSDQVEGHEGPPAPDHLDYAVIRLDTPPEGISPLPFSDPGEIRTGNDMVILQHPSGAPKQIAFGRISSIPEENRRFRYDANTKKGASGSPVLDHAGQPIGLHHAGDPNFSRLAHFNQAVPLALIVADMAANGVEVI